MKEEYKAIYKRHMCVSIQTAFNEIYSNLTYSCVPENQIMKIIGKLNDEQKELYRGIDFMLYGDTEHEKHKEETEID